MPDFNELKQKLCFVRDMKLRATSVSNIEVDEEFCRTDIGEKFLILDKKGEDSDDPEEEDLSTDEDINNRPKKTLFFVESILQTRNEQSAFHCHNTLHNTTKPK
jgi:hypothetical protein